MPKGGRAWVPCRRARITRSYSIRRSPKRSLPAGGTTRTRRATSCLSPRGSPRGSTRTSDYLGSTRASRRRNARESFLLPGVWHGTGAHRGLLGHFPSIKVTAPDPVTVGGLRGVVVDIVANLAHKGLSTHSTVGTGGQRNGTGRRARYTPTAPDPDGDEAGSRQGCRSNADGSSRDPENAVLNAGALSQPTSTGAA